MDIGVGVNFKQHFVYFTSFAGVFLHGNEMLVCQNLNRIKDKFPHSLKSIVWRW